MIKLSKSLSGQVNSSSHYLDVSIQPTVTTDTKKKGLCWGRGRNSREGWEEGTRISNTKDVF